MSYCRWSSDWYRCDLYCFEDVSGGYTTHVAARRYTHDVPTDWDGDESCDVATWVGRHAQISRLLNREQMVPIGLPHDGETFNDPDLASFLARVESLVALGYRVPRGLVDDIHAEITEARGA